MQILKDRNNRIQCDEQVNIEKMPCTYKAFFMRGLTYLQQLYKIAVAIFMCYRADNRINDLHAFAFSHGKSKEKLVDST